MSKLTKFLSQHGSLAEVHESGSIYYTVSNRKIRISDHLPLKNTLGGLSIILPQNTKKQYIIILNSMFYVHNSFTTLKSFLEHWILIQSNDEKMELVKEREALAKMEAKLLQKEAEMQKLLEEKYTPAVIATGKKGKVEVKNVNSKTFTKAQWSTITAFLTQNKQNGL